MDEVERLERGAMSGYPAERRAVRRKGLLESARDVEWLTHADALNVKLLQPRRCSEQSAQLAVEYRVDVVEDHELAETVAGHGADQSRQGRA